MKTKPLSILFFLQQQLRMPGKFSQKVEQMDVNLRLQSKLALRAFS